MMRNSRVPELETGPGRRLALVVPMYNERAGAESCVRQILELVPTLGIEAGLIVVDDGSTDRTGELLDELRAAGHDFLVAHKPNGGYGSAISFGARLAHEQRFDYVVFMDSDLTNPPAHVTRFVPSILGGADLVKGSRFSAGGDMTAVPWRRRVFSEIGNLVARALFRIGLADCTNGFRAIRIDCFLKMPLKENDFAVIMEELYWAKRLGMSVASVPTTLDQRSADLRPSTFSYRPRLIWKYLCYAVRAGSIPYRPARRGDS